MNKVNDKAMSLEMKNYLTKDEQVLWYDRPNKTAYVLGASLTLFPIAILWLAIDGGIIATMISSFLSQESMMLFILIPFFALHLMPVWIWIGSIIKANTNHKFLEYCLTNERIIIIDSNKGLEYKSVFVDSISNINCAFSMFDKKLGVGDITITTQDNKTYKVFDCKGYDELFKTLNSYLMNKKFDDSPKFCEYCGSKLLEGMTACSNCGAKLTNKKNKLKQ